MVAKNRFSGDKKGQSPYSSLVVFRYLFIFLIVLGIISLFIFASRAIYYCATFESQDVDYVPFVESNLFQKSPESFQTFLNVTEGAINKGLNKSRGWLGFDYGLCSFLPDLFVALFAGLIIWGIYAFMSYFAYLQKWLKGSGSYRSSNYNPFEKISAGWFGFVGGKLWRVLVFAFGYAVLMQLPFIGAILRIITLDFYIQRVASKIAYLVFLVGVVPGVFEWFWKERVKAKLKKQTIKKIEEGRI